MKTCTKCGETKPLSEFSADDASTTYTATLTTGVRAADGVALAANDNWTFTTQGPPPQVTTRTPANGATAVSRTTTVTAAFDRDLDPATVIGANVKLTGPGGTSVPAAVSYDNATRRITLAPSATLAASTTYTATLTTGLKATDGAALAATVTWTFTTQGPPPAVTARTPAAGAILVSRTTNVTATFDRALDPATVTGQNVTLTGPGSTAVAATVTYASATRRITLKPVAALAAFTTYTARLTTGLKATDGAALAAPVTWTFMTR